MADGHDSRSAGGGAGRPSPTERAALLVRDVDKAFYGVKANDGVDFDVRWGEVHALLGENGAGKSTLCSIVAGLYRPDGGEVRVDGRPVRFRSPGDALAAGVGMVYQHFRLVPNLTVAENVVLGHPGLDFTVSGRDIERTVAEIGARYRLDVDPAARVWQLSVGEQQRVEILKLLHRGVRILILDEPTAVLTPQESEALFTTMSVMRDEGKALVFVSHKLGEVMSICDRVTVLRDGRMVGTTDVASADARGLARMMVGRDLDLPERTSAADPGEVALDVRGLRVVGDRGIETVRGAELTVRRGEILGLAGVSGNGQRELAEAIAGIRAVVAGSVAIAGTDVTRSSARRRIEAGLGFVPENRLGMGLAPGLTMAENLGLKAYRRPPFSRGPLLDHEAFRRRAADLIGRFDIRGVQDRLPVRLLSGGNLQKAVLAREITHQPVVLIAAAPTRGLDVGATEAVRRTLLEQRAAGTAVLLISEDLDEILALADRIAVIYDGQVVGEMPAAAADVEQLGLLMAGRGVDA